jgi:O-antigen ligase
MAQGGTILARTLSAAPSRRALDWVVPVLAAATVVAFAAGSSSVAEVKEAGLDVRWIVLAALLAAAVSWAPDLRRLRAAVLLATGGFVALSLVSSLWSVAPRLSAGRGLSLALLLATAALLAARAQGSTRDGRRVLSGLLAGAVTVALLGVVVLAASYDTAVVAATLETPARYRGFGENANTVPLLLALAVPLALHWALTGSDRRGRVAAGAALVLFGATIVASGSRGGLLAAAAGAAVTIALAVRGTRRLALVGAAVLVAVVAAALLQSLPDEASTAPPSAPPASAAPAPRYVDAEHTFPLDNDVGRPLPGGGEPPVERSLLGASGRAEAWRGALAQAAERPFLGFGFGTEDEAFVDRYYGYVGELPESSYIGIALQLGVVGLAALGALVVVLVFGARHSLRSPWTPACAGVVAAGLAAAVVQSYLYSVGNIATATFWIAAFLLAAPYMERAP